MELRYKNWSLGVLKGLDGKDGVTPHIGENGNWYFGDTDTGVSAKGSQGEPGQAFTIVKTYPTIDAMEADHGDEAVLVGQFVMIDTNDVDDPDNARLYLKTDTGFKYITDLSGATGLTGPAGKSAYEIAVDNGFEGTEEEWLDSLTGHPDAIPMVPLTKVEYDALSDEERNSETAWLLTDDEESEDELSGSIESVYSTEETRIGTWIDGKPLYRKVFRGMTPNGDAETAVVSLEGMAIAEVSTFYGSINTSNGYALALNYNNNGTTNYTHIQKNVSIGMRLLQVAVRNQPFVLVLEYTKTTD